MVIKVYLVNNYEVQKRSITFRAVFGTFKQPGVAKLVIFLSYVRIMEMSDGF